MNTLSLHTSTSPSILPRTKLDLQVLYPVILPVPHQKQILNGRAKFSYLSQYARYALRISARHSEVTVGNLKKDRRGAPIPFNGHYWSLSHKDGYVAAVLDNRRIGIDIEKIRPCTSALFRYTASPKEWSLAPGYKDDYDLFFRYWTAKEAVLKTVGIGMDGLENCKVTGVIDHNYMTVRYCQTEWMIEHLRFKDHIASVVRNSNEVQWIVDELRPKTSVQNWGPYFANIHSARFS